MALGCVMCVCVCVCVCVGGDDALVCMWEGMMLSFTLFFEGANQCLQVK